MWCQSWMEIISWTERETHEKSEEKQKHLEINWKLKKKYNGPSYMT